MFANIQKNIECIAIIGKMNLRLKTLYICIQLISLIKTDALHSARNHSK